MWNAFSKALLQAKHGSLKWCIQKVWLTPLSPHQIHFRSQVTVSRLFLQLPPPPPFPYSVKQPPSSCRQVTYTRGLAGLCSDSLLQVSQRTQGRRIAPWAPSQRRCVGRLSQSSLAPGVRGTSTLPRLPAFRFCQMTRSDSFRPVLLVQQTSADLGTSSSPHQLGYQRLTITSWQRAYSPASSSHQLSPEQENSPWAC